jgi:hypothetical protein
VGRPRSAFCTAGETAIAEPNRVKQTASAITALAILLVGGFAAAKGLGTAKPRELREPFPLAT